MANPNEHLAVDPLSLILTHEIYIRLTLPDPNPDELLLKQMRQVVVQLKGNEKKQALARARMLASYAGAMVKALSSGGAKSK